MNVYRFYGHETADLMDIRGLSVRDYYDLLSEIWCAETCAPRMRDAWTRDNPTLGQCSITAFLMQDLFGGKVYGILRSDGNYHCFNDVDGCVFDLTSEQFGDEILDYTNCPEQLREVHFAKAEKRARYEHLKRELSARLCGREQAARITLYERLLREAEQMLQADAQTALTSDALQKKIDALESYYGSDLWKRDFADDEAGLLPKDLPRGVLSEDGIYNLLDTYDALRHNETGKES